MIPSGICSHFIQLLVWTRTLTLGLRPYIFHALRTRSIPNPVIPRTFSDKVLWRKIFDRNPIFISMTDKLEARNLAKNLCPDILLPEIVWEGEGGVDFPFDTIELPVVVKVNNGSGWNFFLSERSEEANRNLAQFFRTIHARGSYGREKGEWAYQPIKRRFYAERELVDENGLPPDDYKLYISNGELLQMHVSHDRWGNKALVNFDPDMQPISVDEKGWRRDYVPKDWHLINNVLTLSRTLSMDLDFVRIDLYVFEGQIYFGEFTLYPGSGTMGSSQVRSLRAKGWDISRSHYFREPLTWFRMRYLTWLVRRC